MNATLDLRDYDQHEHPMTPTLHRAAVALFDLALAQRIRESMRAQGMRIPLTDAECFAEAEKRMRGQG